MKYRVKITGFKFGVPSPFIGCNYNPEQFEIIGVAGGESGYSIGVGADVTVEQFTAWKKQTKSHIGPADLVYIDDTGVLIVPFTRILIRLK